MSITILGQSRSLERLLNPLMPVHHRYLSLKTKWHSKFLDLNILFTTQGHLRTNYKFKTSIPIWSTSWTTNMKLSPSSGHTFTFTYPLTTEVTGTPQMTSQPVSTLFLCSPLLSWTWWTPGLSILWSCLPTSFFLSASSSSSSRYALQDGFGQTWWTGDISVPLQIASLKR